MTFGIGPYLRIVKMPKFSPASVSVVLYQDQMGLSVALGDVSYNGIINDLPVAEGDVVSIYLFYQEDPKGTSAETFFVKPTNYSETLTAFPEGGLASFAADPKTHLLASFAVKPPAAASSGEPPAPSGIRVQRPDGLRDFSNYLVK
jgi:hypothetical protein